ncbi:MAG: ECF transporter S component [Candidatus Hodarchaeales archaeon]|jgi:energy-coupling factor transport system substrate-specific component
MEIQNRSKQNRPYYFETSDLVIIALFSALGGVASVIVHYMGKTIGLLTGLPIGGGQIFSGLHIFWFVLVFLLTNRKIGVVILCGVMKGFVELFMGSSHGVMVVFISIGEAVIFEIVFYLLIALIQTDRFLVLVITITSGFSSTINIIIQLFVFFGYGIPLELILLVLGFSFFSGMVFGGLFGIFVFNVFNKTKLLSWRREHLSPAVPYTGKMFQVASFGIVSIIILSFIGSTFLYFQSPQLNTTEYSIDIVGSVNNPYRFFTSNFSDYEQNIVAEEITAVVHRPAKNYTGIPLSRIISNADPINSTYSVKIVSFDGYFVFFTNVDIEMTTMIITTEENGLRLIAADFLASNWVREIREIEII